jgi:hypothetical protein
MSTHVQEARDDLRFVRRAVEARATVNPAEARLIYSYWALYVLAGYLLIDVAPRFAGIFFMAGGVLGGLVSWWAGRLIARRRGEVTSRAESRRDTLHWAGGILLALAATAALAITIPPLRGPAASQVALVMIGVVYFYWGVYADRNFLWLGPVLMAGAIAVRFIPHYPWTSVGAVIALGLVLAGFLAGARQPKGD